jgi:enoyl-CoA hydratase
MTDSAIEHLRTLTYQKTGKIARIALNRPDRGNGITFEMPRELAALVERANLDPDVHVIALSGNGKGFCGGYDLVNAEDPAGLLGADLDPRAAPPGSPLDPAVIAGNHDPARTWDPMVDYAMMSRNLRGFMSLFHGDKPVVCKVHGFCVAGGTDMALCSDLLVIADDAKIGYPPCARLGRARPQPCGSTASASSGQAPPLHRRLPLRQGGRRLGPRRRVRAPRPPRRALRGPPPADRPQSRINQLVMMKLLVNQSLGAQGLQSAQILGTVFDGLTRHTPEGYAFRQQARIAGFRQAVRARDEPFGDHGPPPSRADSDDERGRAPPPFG